MSYPPFALDQEPYWQIVPTFSSPISTCNIDFNITKQLYDFKDTVEWLEDIEDDGCLGAVTKDKNILSKLPDVEKHLRDKCLSYVIDTMKYPCDIQFTSSWFTRTYEGGRCERHSHTNSWLSGIVYFGAYDNDSAPLVFYNPNHITINVEPFDYNYFNSLSWELRPRTNMMVLFPSSLQHQVLIHKTDIKRYSLAFNIMPKGSVGHDDSNFEY